MIGESSSILDVGGCDGIDMGIGAQLIDGDQVLVYAGIDYCRLVDMKQSTGLDGSNPLAIVCTLDKSRHHRLQQPRGR